MNEKTSKFGKTAASVALAASLGAYAVAPACAYAADGQAKDEIVYAKTSPSGSTEGVYVVNVFDSENAERVEDPANYQQVENLTTSDALEQTGGAVSVNTTAGVPFYYQGTMDASTQLPWNVSVKYYLNGKETSASELSGANGLLKVVLDVQPAQGAGASDFADSYVLQAQGTFSQETFAIADAGDATVAHSGSNEVATCLVLPGEGATFEITGVARNFSYDGWQIAGMPLSMAVDLASEDTSELSSATSELEQATSKLSGGASDLFDGASQVASGASSLADGASQLSQGVDAAVAGLDKLSSSGKVVAQGWSKVSAGIEGTVQGIASVKAGSDSFQQGLKEQASQYASAAGKATAAQNAYASAAQAAKTALATYQANPTAENLQKVSDAVSAMDQVAQAMAQTAGASGAYQALSGVQQNYAKLASGIDSLASESAALPTGASGFGDGLSAYLDGADSAASSAAELQSGAAQVASGANSVSDATAQVASGASELSHGSAELASSTNGMDQKIIDQLQDAIDEKLGQDFTPHSFVVPSNINVDSVQFVYVISGVDEPDDEDTTPATEEEQTEKTIIDRFFALFTSQE